MSAKAEAAKTQSAPMQPLDRLQELLDRQDILDCVIRYCRAVDRFDRELLLTVYHPDATDDHGTFVGGPESFADWAFGYHSLYQNATHHIVTNHTCDLDGDVAHTETYWIFSGANKDAESGAEQPSSMHFGRYIDRFERRNGKWAIAARACIVEWHAACGEVQIPADFAAALAGSGVQKRNRDDLSYRRPLQVRPTTAR
jgi:hypothetical protein